MKKALALLLFAAFAGGCEQTPKTEADSGASAAASSSTASSTAVTGEVVAVVNGVELPASRLTIYTQSPAFTETQRQQIIDNMIISEIIAQEAVKQGYADKPVIQDELAVARQAVLGRAYAADFLDSNPADAAESDALYQEMLKELGGKEYDVAHILVPDEQTANALLAEVNKDASAFARLAEQHSQDPGSAAQGGKLGWVAPAALVPEFGEAMKALGKGEISAAPVQTSFGWHIIRVDDTRDTSPPPLTDQMREQLSQRAQAEKLASHIEELREKAKVEIR